MNVLFDVDDTLILWDVIPTETELVIMDDSYIRNEPVIEILIALAKDNHSIYVASGGGIEYAKMWVRRLEIENYVTAVVPKYTNLGITIDLAFDDQPAIMGKIRCLVIH